MSAGSLSCAVDQSWAVGTWILAERMRFASTCPIRLCENKRPSKGPNQTQASKQEAEADPFFGAFVKTTLLTKVTVGNSQNHCCLCVGGHFLPTQNAHPKKNSALSLCIYSALKSLFPPDPCSFLHTSPWFLFSSFCWATPPKDQCFASPLR